MRRFMTAAASMESAAGIIWPRAAPSSDNAPPDTPGQNPTQRRSMQHRQRNTRPVQHPVRHRGVASRPEDTLRLSHSDARLAPSPNLAKETHASKSRGTSRRAPRCGNFFAQSATVPAQVLKTVYNRCLWWTRPLSERVEMSAAMPAQHQNAVPPRE